MEPYRLITFGALFAIVLAANLEPILPTPSPPELSADNSVDHTIHNSTSASDIATTTIRPPRNDTKDDFKKARAMNVSSSVDHALANSITKQRDSIDLSDVSMDNEDADLEFSGHSTDSDNDRIVFGDSRVVNKPHIVAEEKSFVPIISKEIQCVDAGKTYKVGESIERGCEEKCKCEVGGRVACEPRCQGPFFRRGKKVDDPLCSEKETEDPCCGILVCAADARSIECSFGNKTHKTGETFHDGCKQTCTCEEGGSVACKSRCPILEQRDDCVNIKDTNDPCCMLQLCDVSQDIDDFKTRDGKMHSNEPKATKDKMNMEDNKISDTRNDTKIEDMKPIIKEPISSVSGLPDGKIQVTLKAENVSQNQIHLELSKDGGFSWSKVKLVNGLIENLQEGMDYMIRSNKTNSAFKVKLPKSITDNDISSKVEKKGCMHKGKHRSIDEEFHMGCDELCVCNADGEVECFPIQCPSSVGLDVLDPICVKWAPDPPDFVPSYPMCCPPTMKCVSNGSCSYKEHMIPNWSEVPLSLSGCDKRCFCESGMLECQSVCAPLPALPPASLHCTPPSKPAPILPPGDTCCKEWACTPSGNGKNLTDSDKDVRKNHKNNIAPPSIFVTLPPDLHKALKETLSTPTPEKKYKLGPTNETTPNKKDPNIPQSTKSDKKHYEYPGPFADPNHQPQPQSNGLGPFPFIKKYKDKPTYQQEPNGQKDDQNEVSNKFHQQHKPEDHDEYPINDPYLSGNPLHVPFNQNHNNPGPGYFNPGASKNQQDYLNILQQHNNGNQPSNAIYNNAIPSGNQIPQSPETIHVYTDGSPVNIEHILQHIQQTDPNVGSYVPFLTRPHQSVDNENSTSIYARPGIGAFPSSPVSPPFGGNGNVVELQVVEIEPVSPTIVRLVLSLPPVMVGLQGRVKLRYTSTNNPDTNTWQVQEFAPRNDLLASQQLEFQLPSLQPDTLYHIQASVVLRQLSYETKSQVYSVRTLPLQYQEKTTLPPMIPIEPNLSVGQVNATSVQITWRPFTADELMYIDGIQLRYREIDGKLFSGTPLIHRVVTSSLLEGLKPNTSYEVGIYFIPFLGQHTELQSPRMLRFNTSVQTDMYDWSVDIDIKDITPWSLMIKWNGVPRPAERFVHVYRAVWRAEASRLDASTFLLPIHDAPQEVNITNLTPGTKYRIWLELFMTNGKIKNSNVKDILTRPGKPIPEAALTHEGKQLDSAPRGDYYSSLVVVAILAALGAMCSLVLLLVLLRRHRTASAPICGPTPTPRTNAALPPYDSPTYKLDLHQETMDL